MLLELIEGNELLLIGVVMVVSSIVIYLRTKKLHEIGEVTVAKVVGSEYHEEAKYYLFEFEDYNGELITRRSSMGNSIRSYEKGERVEIIYDREDPSILRVNGPDYASKIIFLVGISFVMGYLYTQLNS